VTVPAEFDRLKVILVNARNPLNIGAAARAMSNFGFLRLRVVNPYDAGFREARSAVGASAVLADAQEFATVAEAVADCTLVVGTTAVGERELHHRVRPLAASAKLMRKRMRGSNVALLFGSERVGLSNEELSHCHWLLRIPTRVEHRSMNLGQAVAICMYELGRLAEERTAGARGLNSKPASGSAADGATSRSREADERSRKIAKQRAQKKPASAGDVERITATLMEALHSCGYLHAKSGKIPGEKIRRLLRRHNLTANDADLWQSMLGQIVWKLKAGEKNSK
jgi:TrmH family RNA methyltransferase